MSVICDCFLENSLLYGLKAAARPVFFKCLHKRKRFKIKEEEEKNAVLCVIHIFSYHIEMKKWKKKTLRGFLHSKTKTNFEGFFC